MELIAGFGILALQERDVDAILQRACELSAHGLKTQFAKLLLFRASTNDFLVTHGVGWRPGVVGHARIEADLASPAGYAFHTMQPVVSTPLSEEPRFRTPPLLAEHNIHRAINVIVCEEGVDPWGVLEADSTDRSAFTQDDVAYLQALANVLAAVLQRKRDQDAQQQLLKLKDTLMQEVHHRTKNSLQIVQTMLHLQARSIPDGAEKSRLTEAASRIMTIAAVHRHLQMQDGDTVMRVELASYMDGLLPELIKSLGPTDDSRPVAMDVPVTWLAPEQVTPVGLIAAELVTNALKYGAGPIGIRAEPAAGEVTLTIEDEGPGFPPDYDLGSRSSLGMRLIVALARTPDAITVSRDGQKTRVKVRVLLPEVTG